MRAHCGLWRMLGVACALGALAPSISATSIKPISVETLTQRSELVVEARAERSWAQWNPQHTLIYTYTRFATGHTLKGTAPPEFTVRQMGGSAGGYMQHVAGLRYWLPNEEAVLFLRPSEERGVMSVVGLMQGNFMIARSPEGVGFASNGVPGVEIYAPGQQGAQEYSGARIPLRELERRVLKAARK